MPKPRDQEPFTVRCPNCRQTREPEFNETKRRYTCPICGTAVDQQVFIEKKKRGMR